MNLKEKFNNTTERQWEVWGTIAGAILNWILNLFWFVLLITGIVYLSYSQVDISWLGGDYQHVINVGASCLALGLFFTITQLWGALLSAIRGKDA